MNFTKIILRNESAENSINVLNSPRYFNIGRNDIETVKLKTKFAITDTLIKTPLILKGKTSDIKMNITGPREHAKNIIYKTVEIKA